jgi:xylulokinase
LLAEIDDREEYFMRIRDSYLAIDFGTSNVHVLLIDSETTEIIASSNKKYGWYTPVANQIELDAEEVWKASEIALDALLKKLPEDVRIMALGFSFFGDNITPVDKNGQAIYSMLPSFCGRSHKEVDEIAEVIGKDEYARITGNTLTTLSTPSKIMWLRNNEPDVFERAEAFYTNQQYVMHKLGFGDVQDTTMAARKLAYDIKGNHWSQPILDLAGVKEEQLGVNIVESATVVGYITQYGDVNLPYKIPVTIGCHDVSASLLAAGVDVDGSDTMGVLMGTFEQMGYFSDTFVDGCNDFSDTLIFSCCYNSPFKDRYTVMAGFPTAGALLEWFRNNILKDPNADIGKLIEKAPLNGQNTMFVLPYVENFHGAITGISLSTTTEDIFEALLESLAYQFRSCVDYIQSTRKEPLKKLHIGGGGSRTDKLLQLRADLINMPIGRMDNIELPSIGACMLAGIGNGWFSSPRDAARKMVNRVRYFEPNEKNGQIYRTRYDQYRAISKDYLHNY